ncbi:hypothetical protein Taro_032963 [Colocasia esculenta]|uniref:RINT1-like protein MAG2L n=1 Tax=Colocasia esculenta TaxID=4460 RepID=A0A843VU10_COLES|nr:hypothetical protein [Colocasia esculenta]
MAGTLALPSPSELPRRLLAFLDERLRNRDDLRRVASLAAEVGAECDALTRDILREGTKLSSFAEGWAARYDRAGRILRHLKSDMGAPSLRHSPEGNGERSSSRMQRILGTEIPMLAKEVGRIENVRLYVEAGFWISIRLSWTLGKLLVANVSYSDGMQGTTWKQETLLLAIKTMEDMEKILTNIAKCQLQWTHLLMAVDLRVENTLAVLRPQALMDHRSILASIGWPPSLTTSILKNGGNVQIQNPLVMMKENKKEIYSQSFMALLGLQVLLANRGGRRHNLLTNQRMQTSPGFTELGNEVKLESGIWTIDELVYPIASRVEHHFSRWSQQPEFIFALTYRITRNLLEGVDIVVQPLIDETRLVGFSAREAWISAMVKMLAAYLRKSIFPDLSRRFHSESIDLELTSSWLNLIDHIIAFDKKMRTLASSQIFFMSDLTEFDGTSALQPLSVLSLFCDHSGWIEIWAQIELRNAQDKLAAKLDIDEAWAISIKQESGTLYDKDANLLTFSATEDYKAPLVADFVIRMTWSMIEKGWGLPSLSLKIKFIRSSANIFLHEFSNILHQYCQELEDVSIMNSDLIQREASSINAARYCESTILEWSDNVNFLEMYTYENDDEVKKGKSSFSCFFADEIEIFSKLQTDYLMEIISAILVEFDYCCYDYIQNSEKWGEDLDDHNVNGVLAEGAGIVSHEFIQPLDMLIDRLQILKVHLNFKDFIDLWRSVAGGLDHFVFRSILLSSIRFSDGGMHQFRTDMLALFHVFKPFCIRSEAFFPCIGDSLKLFGMCLEDVKHLKVALKRQERDRGCLHRYGLFHISIEEAEKILSIRK